MEEFYTQYIRQFQCFSENLRLSKKVFAKLKNVYW